MLRPKLYVLMMMLVLSAIVTSASSLIVPMSGSKWSLYASGGVIKCGVSVCGNGQALGTLPNGEGIYFDFPNAPDLPVGSYIIDQAFVGTGPNDAYWLGYPPITAPATFCVVITQANAYTDGAGPHDAYSWGTGGSCTDGGVGAIQSTEGLWLKDGVLIYFARMNLHSVGDKWTVNYGYGTAATDWRGYLMTVPATKSFTTANMLSMTVEMQITGSITWGYHPDNDWRCIRPVTIRPHFQKGSWDKWVDDSYRWWTKEPYSFTIENGGSMVINVPLQPSNWIQTWGKSGDSTPAMTTNFINSIKSIGALGAAIGGGCSYGHGANIQGDGSARLILRSYSIH